jgi:hypothetical protein
VLASFALAERFTASGDVLTLMQRNQFGTEPEREEVHMLNRRPPTSWEPDAPPKLAEEVYKNIQIMKGIPAPRLQTVMANLTRWLGVECSYCHVGTEFEKDDKPGKQTARKMFLMVRAIGNETLSRVESGDLLDLPSRRRQAAKPAAAMKSRGLRNALLVWLAWTLFALFAASQNYLSRAYYTPIEWGPALRLALLDSYVWALLTPAVFWVVARIDPRRGNLRWTIPLAVIASLVFAAGHLALFMQVMPHLGFPVSRLARNAIPSTKLHSNILTCWALMGIQYYLARERRARELAARLEVAQLEALRMQLEPHFLFNTLHAISALMYRDVEGADRMITRLSDFLRLTLDSAGQQEVTLMREMEYLDKYLEIEQVRFGDRLEVRRSIAPGTLDLMVPNLALQPLVENAVRHGIAPRAEGGRDRSSRRVWTTVRSLLKCLTADRGPPARSAKVSVFRTLVRGWNNCTAPRSAWSWAMPQPADSARAW